jgi:hypothetical protein
MNQTVTQPVVKPLINTQGPSRHRARWTVPEINRLHSEYEMKELTVYQIAALHNRTVKAILSKLQAEELIDPTWQNARGWSESNEYVLSPTSQSQTKSQSSVSVLDELIASDDDDESCFEVEDDLNDGDYEPQDDDDEEEEEDEDFIDDDDNIYDLRLKVQKLERQMVNLYNFIKDNMNLSKQKMKALEI